jgi:UDP-2,3-diacylglucosamine hydrolase
MIAIIAGTGKLPIEACKSLKSKQKDFFVISLFPQDNFEDIRKVTKNIITQKVYKAGKILELLKEKKTTHVLLIGKVDKRNIFKKVKLDWFSIKFLASTFCKNDKTIMEEILKIFKKNNIEVLKQSDVLKSLFVEPGVLSGKITDNIKKNIEMGMNLAKKISESEIGQTVVIKDGMIISVEAIEGTDECVKRGIDLAKKNIVICKAACLNQNKKYDLPTLGTNSLKSIKKGEVAAIAWQSSQTFIADKDEFVKLAKKLNITLVSV